jgi:steroid delta-isomerase
MATATASSPAQMKAALQRYVDGFNAADAEAIVALFADDAVIEDPVGGGTLRRGRAEIAEFYRGSVKLVKRIELSAPIRGSHGNAAAMAFAVHLDYDGKPCVINVIDVMRFDDTGRIVEMKAYWGPGDVVAG